MVEVYTTTEVDSQVNDLATTLNAQIATLAQSVEALEARVVALEAIEPPPPDPDPDPPPPDPDPGPGPTPPDDAIQVDPGDSIPAAITKAAAEKRDVWLVNGTHQLGQPLDGLANIKMLSDGAILRGSGPGGHHLVKEGGPCIGRGSRSSDSAPTRRSQTALHSKVGR